MVNTFLPYADFKASAEALDYKRLGKQRVEAWQILQALRGQTKGWTNHPATNMWRGYEKALCNYGIAICDEWIKRGYKDTMRERFIAVYSDLSDCDLPPWIGDPLVHESHQSKLNGKDPEYYDFPVMNEIPYYWYKGSFIGSDQKQYVKYRLGNFDFEQSVVIYQDRQPIPEHLRRFNEHQVEEDRKKRVGASS